jgi:tRNA nucleotidyltransferase (CCA-adding enzyme)
LYTQQFVYLDYNSSMEVILTHEQADFDALGALLGAYLLNDHSWPVLPRRTNRNVRSFLNLYGAELPFVDLRDLPPETIEKLTLVDTQSLVTLKGMTNQTQIQVIDHHQKRPELSASWSFNGERLGSCTTIFVEALHEHNGDLTPVHATLMLLGIYEDTGSLTYAGTTPRDVHAAAFLLEQGASLRIAAEYLNPPLSAEQRLVYARLESSVETHVIEGQRIMVGRANAEDMNEEISSVAHKLRDLLDPDALFLLVSTPEGIRLVGRSTTDQVDVSSIAAQFGGGGHERAAAALIRPENLPDNSEKFPPLDRAYQKLMEILPTCVKPSITIGQIMSRQPRLLTPRTSVHEAERLMQRYGYEGFPVVIEDKVIGLLTRRSVDRAISHKLNLNAESLMDAGEVTVHTGDTLSHLQRLMTETGWGQIPVLDSGNKIIGIVTRTDLLKTLAGDPGRFPGKINYAARLESALEPANLALLKQIAEIAHKQRLAVYIVGGFVRDLLLDHPAGDFDVVIEGDAIALGRSLAAQFGGRLVSHRQFGTTKWWIAENRQKLVDLLPQGAVLNQEDLPESIDLISARSEFYEYPTALPIIERSGIKLDLHRRDFTINTMALRLDGRHYGELYDYWGD